jgi:hypothetical protein
LNYHNYTPKYIKLYYKKTIKRTLHLKFKITLQKKKDYLASPLIFTSNTIL